MFALDNTLGCIEASESDVLDLFQSPPLTIPLHGSKPVPRAAYVFTVKRKTDVQVYVSLVAEYGRNFVYTNSGSNDSVTNYEDSLQEALEFARSLGYAPEPVNLNYSPAMRAVVIRNFKILSVPGSKTHALQKKGVGNAPVAAKRRIHVSNHDSPTEPSLPDVPAASVASVASDAAPPAVLTGPKDGTEEQGAIADVLRKLSKEMETMAAERDALSAQVRGLSALQQQTSAELDRARMGYLNLKAERDLLTQSAADTEMLSSDLAALQNELALISQQRDEADQRHKDLLAERAALAETASSVDEDKAKLIVERDAALRRTQELTREKEIVSAEKDALRAVVDSLSAEKEALGTEAHTLTTERDALFAEVSSLTTERDALGAEVISITTERAALHAKVTSLLAERDALRTKASSISTEREALRAEVGSISAERETLRAEVGSISAEREALRAALISVSTERDALRGEVTSVPAVKKTLHAEVAAVSAEREALRAEVCALSAAREAGLLRLEKLELQNAAKDAELDTMRGELTTLRAEREMLLEHDREQSLRLETIEAQFSTTNLSLQRAEPDLPSEHDFSQAASGQMDQREERLPELAELADYAQSPVTATQTAALGITEPAWQAPDFADFPASSFSGAPQDGYFSSFSEETEACHGLFLMQPGQAAIEYAGPEDVIELYRSINLAHIAPDGKGQESCQAYVCSLKRGAAVEVYAALYGTQSGKTTVYLPEMQPADERALAGTLAGAISFAEQVGLMMERVKLGTPQQRAEFIMSCPVLRKRSNVEKPAVRNHGIAA